MSATKTFTLWAALAALFAFTKRSEAATSKPVIKQLTYLPDDVERMTYEDLRFENEGYQLPGFESFEPIAGGVGDSVDKNRQAFLYAIRASEHIFPRDVKDGLCYSLFYGRKPFVDMSDHPVLTGELAGTPLPDKVCVAAGYGPGCVSTAAGAYQITLPTWREFRSDGPYLDSFSPENQDEAALRILRKIGALDYIDAGDFETATQIAGQRWASLPGAFGRQKQRSDEFVSARIRESLEGLA